MGKDPPQQKTNLVNPLFLKENPHKMDLANFFFGGGGGWGGALNLTVNKIGLEMTKICKIGERSLDSGANKDSQSQKIV